MPSPISHVAVGAALYEVWVRHRFGPGPHVARIPLMLVATVGLTVLPDLDAVLGIALGNLAGLHNNFAGTPAFGTLAALVVASAASLVRRTWFAPAFVLAFICYQLHVLMDFVTVGRGLMMLWPLSDQRIQPPFHLFYGLRWSDGLVSDRHWITLASESGFVILLALAVWVLERRRARRRRNSS